MLQNTNNSNTTAAKEGHRKVFCRICNVIWTLIFWFLSSANFLRTLNYSQSFREQVVMFSSVIILSEKKNTEYELYLNLFQHFPFIIYLIWSTVSYTVRQTLLLRNVTRNTKLLLRNIISNAKLWGTQRSPELSLRSTDFSSPENLIFPALTVTRLLHTQFMWNKKET